MKNSKAAPVCEGAIVTALTVLLLTMGMYVPVLGSFCGLVSGIPLLWLMIRRSTGVSVASLVASLALIFALTGDIISGPLSAFILLHRQGHQVFSHALRGDCRRFVRKYHRHYAA